MGDMADWVNDDSPPDDSCTAEDSALLVCAWCGRVMREGTEPTSHGICPPCARVMREEVRRDVLRNGLDEIDEDEADDDGDDDWNDDEDDDDWDDDFRP